MSDFKTILFNVLPILINITYSIVLTFFYLFQNDFYKTRHKPSKDQYP